MYLFLVERFFFFITPVRQIPKYDPGLHHTYYHCVPSPSQIFRHIIEPH